MAYATAAVVEHKRSLGAMPALDWSARALGSFLFQMSEHEVSVCASRMIADPDYAREKLRLACTFDDQALQQLAVEMLHAIAHRSSPRNPAVWPH